MRNTVLYITILNSIKITVLTGGTLSRGRNIKKALIYRLSWGHYILLSKVTFRCIYSVFWCHEDVFNDVEHLISLLFVVLF